MAGKIWVACPFQNSRGYFTTGWIAFAIDNELKVDNKLLFIITSPFSIIVKVLGSAKAMLSADDKVDKNDYENDTEKEDIVDEDDYKEKDKDDDDDGKVVKLASKNEEHFYQEDNSMVLINFDEDEDDEKLPKSQTPWLHQHIN
jgi:hypothetical protein